MGWYKPFEMTEPIRTDMSADKMAVGQASWGHHKVKGEWCNIHIGDSSGLVLCRERCLHQWLGSNQRQGLGHTSHHLRLWYSFDRWCWWNQNHKRCRFSDNCRLSLVFVQRFVWKMNRLKISKLISDEQDLSTRKTGNQLASGELLPSCPFYLRAENFV